MYSKTRRSFFVTTLALMLVGAWPAPSQAQLTAAQQAKVDAYVKKMVKWAADPVFVSAARSANAAGGAVPGMTNAKWVAVADNDPQVVGIINSPAGKACGNIESSDKGISKLYVRDNQGALVASSHKPVVFNNSSKPWIEKTLAGAPFFNGKDVKPDPTTQVKGIHLAVPIYDQQKVIGVLQTSVIAD